MIAEPTRLPPAVMPDALDPRRQPHLAVVGRIQSELGIRADAPPLAGYGPTSHMSEAELWQGYGLDRVGEEAR